MYTNLCNGIMGFAYLSFFFKDGIVTGHNRIVKHKLRGPVRLNNQVRCTYNISLKAQLNS